MKSLALSLTFMLLIGCLTEKQKKENSQAFWQMMEESQQVQKDLKTQIYEGGVESLFYRRFRNEKTTTLGDVISFINYHFEKEIGNAKIKSYNSHLKLSEQRNRRLDNDLINIMLDGAEKSTDKTIYEIAKDLLKKGGFL